MIRDEINSPASNCITRKTTLESNWKMEIPTASSVLISLVCAILVIGLVKAVNWVWLKPKKLERWLKQQGIPGTPYRFFHGDLKDLSSLRSQAMAKPMSAFSHNYINRIEPFRHQLMAKFAVVTCLAEVVNWIWLRPKKLERWLRQQGIPGTSYTILFGDSKELSSLRSQALAEPISGFSHHYLPRIDPFSHHLTTTFGKEFFIWLGPSPIVTVTKPELIREALTKMQEFRKVKTNPIVHKLFAGFVNYEEEQWAQHRKLVNPAFHIEKLKLMWPAFYESCDKMINKWEKLLPEGGPRELDVWPHLVTLSADVISRAAFGSSYAEGEKIFQLLKEQIDLALKMQQSVYIPGLRYIPTARNRRFKKINDQIQTLLKGIIDKRIKVVEAGEATKDDLLGILIDSYLKDTLNAAPTNNKNQHHRISLQELIHHCKLFYLAGQETTSAFLVWTLILLSKHKDWQARAREEVLQIFGNNAPHFEGLNHLKTVTMILYEILRMYPPATNLRREVFKDTKLGDLSLPAGALLNFQVLYTHRDKELWGEDAHEFRPDRFSEGILKATKGNNTFFPFGGGPRICIGEKFAITEVKMALCMILQHFSLELSPSYVHAPITIFFLQPQHGAQIILHKLK